jgi:uncharacterized protein YutD
MDRETMKALADEQFLKRAAETTIVQGATPEDILINNRPYVLVHNYRDAYEQQMMAARFSDFLEKYDYLVGDIAADQLRLRGFYKDGVEGVPRNQQISSLEDYIFEETNFGAPFFVLQNLEPHVVEDEEEQPVQRRKRRSNGNHRRSKSATTQAKTAAVAEKKKPVVAEKKNTTNSKPAQAKVETKGKNRRRRFQIRERSATKPAGKEKSES